MCYIPVFIKSTYMAATIPDIPHWQLINLVNIIIDYCFSNMYATTAININELLNRFRQIDIANNPDQSVYLEQLLSIQSLDKTQLIKYKKPQKTKKKIKR